MKDYMFTIIIRTASSICNMTTNSSCYTKGSILKLLIDDILYYILYIFVKFQKADFIMASVAQVSYVAHKYLFTIISHLLISIKFSEYIVHFISLHDTVRYKIVTTGFVNITGVLHFGQRFCDIRYHFKICCICASLCSESPCAKKDNITQKKHKINR